MQVHRKYPRYATSWRIVVVYKRMGAHESYCGNVSELSLGGASFFADIKIFSPEPIVATIEIPTHLSSLKSPAVSVKCIILHSVPSSQNGKFRIGIKFIGFNDRGREILAEALSGLVAVNDNSKLYG